MKAEAYLVVAALLLILGTAPTANADDNCPLGICVGDPLPNYPHCMVFVYTIDPIGYTLAPECLRP